jgi:hypothetical protein
VWRKKFNIFGANIFVIRKDLLIMIIENESRKWRREVGGSGSS